MSNEETFLFTSESVGEGHPGMWNRADVAAAYLIQFGR